ncbi:MAG TPA: hypothetical protein VEJ43_05640 [Pseudolabrys sp.]|nr:hypothetical protein [Pseudolabrys sp.]
MPSHFDGTQHLQDLHWLDTGDECRTGRWRRNGAAQVAVIAGVRGCQRAMARDLVA